jgi:fucose permease
MNPAEVGGMHTPKDQRCLSVMVMLSIVICSSFILIGSGVEAAAVKDLLAIVFPPVVALAASAIGTDRNRSGRR